MSEVITAKKGSSLARFLKAAEEGGWDVATETLSWDRTKVVATDPTIEQPTEATYSGPIHAIEAVFSSEGAFNGGNYSVWLQYGNNGEVTNRRAEVKIGEAVGHLGRGPVYRAAEKAKADAKAAIEAKRSTKAREALDAAAETAEVQAYKRSIVSQMEYAEREAVDALNSIIATAKEALEAIKEGKMTSEFGGGVLGGNNRVQQANQATTQRNDLLRSKANVEHLFGPLPKNSWG